MIPIEIYKKAEVKRQVSIIKMEDKLGEANNQYKLEKNRIETEFLFDLGIDIKELK